MDGQDKSWYKVLESMADEISSIGFSIIYLPPPWVDDSHWEKDGKHGGGEGYFWRDFNLNSRYGSKEELKSLIAKFHKNNCKVIIDLVTNHRDRFRMKSDIWEYPGPAWFKGTGKDTGGLFMDGSCDLALDNSIVQNRVLSAMNELMDDCGADGWRWDYVWGYAVEDVVNWIQNTTKEEYFSVGEYWQSSNLTEDPMVRKYGTDEGNRILGWARDSNSCAFDIILKRQINTANASNLKLGLNTGINAEERSSIVTFVDNHDMGASPYSASNGWGQQCWPCPPEFKSRAYCFIITMPGTPCIYWPDCFDWGLKNEIAQLIHCRKEAGIISSSEWVDMTWKYSGFAAYVKNEKGEETLAVSIDSNFQNPGEGFRLACEKSGEWKVWIKI
jgi:alpha-amylase